ncbi:MAG: DUF1540 domain-containing protein [Clostridium sp.]|uniref:DUF1540 domain-containing protein n=1 Tax=Clostridium sp. TaxID=1506 RepID=UPI00304FF6A5
MTKLKCDACSCSHNQDYYCCAGSIAVGGKEATNKSSTCCVSFVENNGAMTNSTETPNPQMEIGCQATNCVHNQSCKCEANEISICGDHACNSRETECSTFSCK